MKLYDAIIIGAGAAGLYAALHAGGRGRSVLVLEHNPEPGAKILISGGGRCNFTNVDAGDHRRYLSANPHFARSALSRHPPGDFVALVRKHNIAHYEKTLGQLFCEGARSSQKILRLLLDQCAAVGATLEVDCRVTAVSKTERFRVETDKGAVEGKALVIATGGRSIPKMGASGFAFEVAKQFAVPIVAPRPGLVPLVFNESDLLWMRPLTGVSAEVSARCGGAQFREAALFTHRGLSGPAILQASSYWREGGAISVDWLPDQDEDWLAQRKRERPRAVVKNVLAEMLPERLAAVLCNIRLPLEGGGVRGGGDAMAPSASGLVASPHPLPPPPLGEGERNALGDLKNATLVHIMRALKNHALTPTGTEGYAKAEVMVGGIDTSALSQQTMQCRAVPGLFFIGECVDVTGWLGGYNFQWAWSSGWAAGQNL